MVLPRVMARRLAPASNTDPSEIRVYQLVAWSSEEGTLPARVVTAERKAASESSFNAQRVEREHVRRPFPDRKHLAVTQ